MEGGRRIRYGHGGGPEDYMSRWDGRVADVETLLYGRECDFV